MTNWLRVAVAAGDFAMASALRAAAVKFDTLTVEQDVALGTYEAVYIAPVEVALDPETRRNLRDIRTDRPVSETDQARNAREFQEDLIRVFGKHFELAEAPGDGVLTINATITRLVSTRPSQADFQRFVGIDFSSIYAGGASFTVELKEGDAPLATITEREQTFLNDGRPRVGVWQDTDYVFSRFSRKLSRYARGK